jgi:Thaumatin family
MRVMFGIRSGRGSGHGGGSGTRWRPGRTRAFGAAVLLTAVAFSAGCEALGPGTPGGAAAAGVTASGPGGPTATASATAGSPGEAAGPGTAKPSPARRPASGHPTLATVPAGTGAAGTAPAGSPRPGTSPAGPATGVPGSPTDPAVPAPPPPAGTAGQRQVTLVNATAQTIWAAAAPSAATPLAATGWVLPAGHSVTIAAPNNLNTRFWGRTGCTFNSAGTGHCQTGDCGGLFQCRGWGTIPATLAEVNFDAWDNLDFYDVSMVDGSNLPMYINITHSSAGTKDKISPAGCVAAGCTKPVKCPSALQVKAGGAVVGCISACARLGGDQYCCRGQWASRAACDPTKWPVDYAAVFKAAEPYAYSYTDDDATSVFTCSGTCDYRITFGITP